MKNFIFLMSGVVIGSIGTWIGVKKYYENQAANEAENVKEYYEETIKDLRTRVIELEADVKVEEKLAEEPKKIEIKKKRKVRTAKPDATVEPDYKDIIDKLNYNKFSTDTTKDDKPIIISGEESGTTDYPEVLLSYFPDDEVLIVSATSEIVDDVEARIGMSNLELIGETGDDEDEIYIRSPKYGEDYHVVLETGSYEDFAGI